MMRLLGLLVLVGALLAGIGYFRGWFHAETRDANGQQTLNVSVDKEKLKQDEAAAKQKLENLEHK